MFTGDLSHAADTDTERQRRMVEFKTVLADLTVKDRRFISGIGGWSVAEIERLLKTGMTPESDMVGSGMKAVVRGTARLTEADRHAIAVNLKTVPPIHVHLPPPQPPSQPPRAGTPAPP